MRRYIPIDSNDKSVKSTKCVSLSWRCWWTTEERNYCDLTLDFPPGLGTERETFVTGTLPEPLFDLTGNGIRL